MSEDQTRAKLAEMIERDMCAMVRLTCTVNLRRHCEECIGSRLQHRLNPFVDSLGTLMEDDFDQFFRQLIVWAKTEAERELEAPCTLVEHADELLPGLGAALTQCC